jgi:hypothetical protein
MKRLLEWYITFDYSSRVILVQRGSLRRRMPLRFFPTANRSHRIVILRAGGESISNYQIKRFDDATGPINE